jgi:hypothetical protein
MLTTTQSDKVVDVIEEHVTKSIIELLWTPEDDHLKVEICSADFKCIN